MRVEVAQVKFQGDEATAAVTITARDDPSASMQMMYRLTRTPEGWEVQDPRSKAGSAAGDDLPLGHPPLENRPGAAAELPSGHPPLNESPPGHPQ